MSAPAFRLAAAAAFAIAAAWLAPAAGMAAPEPTAPPPTATVDLGGGVTMEFVLIKPGAFVMGSDPTIGDGDERPAHDVTLKEPYYFGKHEVTQRQWFAVMATRPSRFQGDARPVENVSWNDCQAFLQRLSAKTGLAFALPTEAQWEFACRAGTATPWYFGARDAALGDHAWVGANARAATHPVGTKQANPWGLYDVYGNVWEWCADWYGNPYPAAASVDPTGPATGTGRVLRGGAWGDDANMARSAYRNSMGADERNQGTGFRCVLRLARPDGDGPAAR